MAKTGAVSAVARAFQTGGLVPDLVVKAPTKLVQVWYGDVEVTIGSEISPNTVKEMPTKAHWDADPAQLYTFILADPDAPNRENATYRSWRHYAVVNINGTDLSTGTVLSSYIGAKPPAKTGLHRYVFLVYKQNDTVNAPSVEEFAARRNWNVIEWAKQFGLGEPIAGNFFEARHEEDLHNGVGVLSLSLCQAVALTALTAVVSFTSSLL